MKRGLTIALLLILASTAASPVAAGERVVKARRLDSGLLLVASPNPWNQIVAFAAVVDAGARRDPEGLSGLAQIANDLMAQGVTTMSADELSELLDKGGMQLETRVSLDWATVRVSALGSDMKEAARVFADVLARPAFEQDALIDMQADALNMIARSSEDPFEDALREAFRVAFGDHPYGNSVLGSREDVESVTLSDVRRFYDTYYGANGTVVVAVGDFEPDRALDMLEEHLADYGPRTAGPLKPVPVERRPARTIDRYRDVKQGVVLELYVAPDLGSDDFLPLQLASAVLGGRESSRLSKAFGGSRTVGAYAMDGLDAGAFVTFAMTDDVDAARGKLGDEIERLRSELITEEELERAKNTFLVSFAASRERNADAATSLASLELLGLGVEFEAEILRRVDDVTREDIQRAARDHLIEPVLIMERPGRSGTRGGI